MKNSANRYKPIPILDSKFDLDSMSIASPDCDAKESELNAVYAFLASYDGSTPTVNSYRRELERLLQWTWHVQSTSLFELNRTDIELFIKFCVSPPLSWIGFKNVSRFIDKHGARSPNKDCRPFVFKQPKNNDSVELDKKHYKPSQASIKAIFTCLSSFYQYLYEEKLVESNPVKLIRQKSKFLKTDQNESPVRRLSPLQWDYVFQTAEKMASDSPCEHERTLFVLTCLFAMYLRISELVADERSEPVMGDFQKDLDGNWWFNVTGKGNKDRSITVSDDMLRALKRYRKARDLSPLPLPNEQICLVPKLRGIGPLTSARQIRLIVQSCFDAAFATMKGDGLAADADELRVATVHWLRHTGISEDVKFRPREHVRDDAGHATMATTDRYIDSDKRERHQSGKL